MILHPGVQVKLIDETTPGSGSTSVDGSIQSDSLIATLWVDSIAGGTLDVKVYTLTDEGKELELFSFPQVSSPTANLLLRKSGISLQRFRVEATYSGICTYEVYVRAVEGAGESSVKLLGAANASSSTATVTNVVGILIPASLVDRSSLILKNHSNVGTLYIGFTPAVTVSDGYPIGPHESLGMDIAAGTVVYSVADVPSIDVRILQAGG